MAGGVGRGQLHLKTLLSERVHETLVAQQDRVAILLRHGHPGPEEESTGGRIGFRPAFDARIVHARWTTGQVDIADRKGVVKGKSVLVRVDLVCRRIIKKKKCTTNKRQ